MMIVSHASISAVLFCLHGMVCIVKSDRKSDLILYSSCSQASTPCRVAVSPDPSKKLPSGIRIWHAAISGHENRNEAVLQTYPLCRLTPSMSLLLIAHLRGNNISDLQIITATRRAHPVRT